MTDRAQKPTQHPASLGGTAPSTFFSTMLRMIRRPSIAIVACLLGGSSVLVGAPTQAQVKLAKQVLISNNLPKFCPTNAFCYLPMTVTVKVGSAVRWENTSYGSHTVTSFGSGPLNSVLLLPGESYAFTFKQTGTYVYYCVVHGFDVMHGTVVVTT